MQALEEDFKKNGGRFEKFRIGDLFDIHPTKSYGLTNFKLFASRGNTPVIVNSSVNNGVGGYVDLTPTEKANTITFSDTTSADSIFLQDCNFIGYSHVQGLYPREANKWAPLSLLYFVAVFKHTAKQYKFDYSYKFNRKIAMTMIVHLPTKAGGEIAFDYMEQYVREVEAERVREVEAYLIASGLNDYQLTKQEKEVLETESGGGYKPRFKEFRLGDLFEKLNARFIGKGNKFKQVSTKPDRDYVIPLVYAKYGDNGIMYWGKPSDFNYYKNTISIIYNGAIAAGLCYAQKEDTSILAESYLIDFKENREEISFEAKLYISSVINKTIYPKYSRDLLATWKNRVENNFITLPINLDNSLDFTYMQTYISAMKKLVIADVVKWKDRELDALRQACDLT